MKLSTTPTGFTIWLSATNTQCWALGFNKWNGIKWPCSALGGRRLRADFDTGGLVDLTIDGRAVSERLELPSDELNAILYDHLKDSLPTDHSCYHVAVGQYIVRNTHEH